MKIFSRKEIDDERWNKVVKSSHHFRHYNLTYFLDAAAPDWSAFILGDYKAVWPLPSKEFPIKRQFQPLLAQQMGPTFSDEIDETFIAEGISEIQKSFWSSNVKFIDALNLPAGFEYKEQLNVELDLNSPYEDLYRNYNRNARSNLKKACNSQLTVKRDDRAVDFVINAFKSSSKAEIKELDEGFYQDVLRIYKAFLSKNEAQCLLALKANIPIAGLMILTSSNRILNFFTATTPEARNTGAMHFLIDFVVKQHAETNIVFDFEGSNDDNLRFFYKSFGGTEKVYLQLQNNRLIWPLNKIIK